MTSLSTPGNLCLAAMMRARGDDFKSSAADGKLRSIEWLYLAAKGHRRARFDLENNKDAWLVP